MTTSFGQPGSLKKTFDDGKFDLVNQSAIMRPARLAAGQVAAGSVVDGQFLSPDASGNYVASPDALRSIGMIFTADTAIIVGQPTTSDAIPGRDVTDTPTILKGFIVGQWPYSALFMGALGGGTVDATSYALNTPLSVKSGKLCPANFGTVTTDRVIGHVEAVNAVLGATNFPAIQAAITT
jgi:hypothetical protein